MIVQGWDLAVNHSGYVELTDGELSNFWYVTNRVGSANRSKKHGCRLVLPKTKDKFVQNVSRLNFAREFIVKNVLKENPDYVGVENYSYASKGSVYQMGEIGSVARILLWRTGIPFRLHDPISVKMFVTHDGTCQKDLVEKFVYERWDVDFSAYNQPKSKTGKEDRTTSEDLCDAFSIAKLVWTELLLRKGKIKLEDMHEKEIQVFNRVTKTYPVNLLSREWIHRDVK
jgi:Holliday junction resolvasome RuvABC endonuclease subunit